MTVKDFAKRFVTGVATLLFAFGALALLGMMLDGNAVNALKMMALAGLTGVLVFRERGEQE